MLEFIFSLGQWSLDFLSQGGYLGVFLLSVADRVAFQFIPGEVVFPLLGFLVSQAKFSFIPALFMTVFGNLVGDIAIYFVSLKGGRRIIEKFGRYLSIEKEELDYTEDWFKRYGDKVIFWGRFIPIVVTFISIPAGLAKMDFKKFSFFTFLGSLPRNFILIYAGFKLGENWMAIVHFFEKGQSVIISLLILGVVWYVYRWLKHKYLR